MDVFHDKENKVTAPISKSLQDNINLLEVLFTDCGDYVKRTFTIGGINQVNVYMAYVDNMVDRVLLEHNIIRNLIFNMDMLPSENQYDYIMNKAVQSADITEETSMDTVTQAIMAGDVALFIDGVDQVIVISLKDYPGRGVPTVETEVSVRGAKDSFTESIALNKVLIRRRIRDTNLKIESMKVGIRSRTDVSIAYISGIAENRIIKEIKKKINSFTIDGIFDVGMLEQLTEKAWYSPFPQYQTTERPDKASSALMEGRIAILVDNSPMVLLLPVTMISFFQAADDYYSRWEIASFIRILRYIGALLAIGMPGIYIAVTNYQPEMIPTPLALSFAASRLGVPFSIVMEMIILQLAFELLTEAGIRLPSPMGNTIGIVGGLIVGDAAVSANLVSPMVVIVVAFTAIASYTIPNEMFTSAFRLLRYLIIFLSSILGLYGFILGMMMVLIHLSGLKSFGIPYLSPFAAADVAKESSKRDAIIKLPIFKLRRRPVYARKGEKIRLTEKEEENNE